MYAPAHTPSTPLRLTDILHPVVAGLVSVIVNYGGLEHQDEGATVVDDDRNQPGYYGVQDVCKPKRG